MMIQHGVCIHTHMHMYIFDHIFNSSFQKPNCSVWSVFLRLAVMFLYIVTLTHAVNEPVPSIMFSKYCSAVFM
jgi:hypothetical protein